MDNDRSILAHLPNRCRHTYVRHMAFALLEAATAGILANAPVMALKGMGSPDWQLALQLSISSVGMFLVLYLGGRMALRRKKPYVLVPGFAHAVTALLMVATDQVLLFLVLLGLGTLFEVITRAGVTTIIRLNYPATHRGAVTGEIRRWCSIVFVGTSLLSAQALDLVASAPALMIKGQMLLAGLLSAGAFLCFRTIQVNEDEATLMHSPGWGRGHHFREAWQIVRSDHRYRRYLLFGFLYAFGALVYVPFVPVLLVKELHYSYTSASLLTHILPSLVAFLMTAVIGRWLDGTNPWRAWAWIRLGWGVDPALLGGTLWLAKLFAPAAVLLPIAGRLSRGAVMGGSWILWWQVGVNHFAPPGGDTSRYMGLMIFTNGICRLLAPLAGASLLVFASLPAVFLVGSVFVLFSAILCAIQFRRERAVKDLATIARFEDSFSIDG